VCLRTAAQSSQIKHRLSPVAAAPRASAQWKVCPGRAAGRRHAAACVCLSVCPSVCLSACPSFCEGEQRAYVCRGSAVRASHLGLERSFLRLPAYASGGVVGQQERGFERLGSFWMALGERAGGAAKPGSFLTHAKSHRGTRGLACQRGEAHTCAHFGASAGGGPVDTDGCLQRYTWAGQSWAAGGRRRVPHDESKLSRLSQDVRKLRLPCSVILRGCALHGLPARPGRARHRSWWPVPRASRPKV
jgi:hypothetical protein